MFLVMCVAFPLIALALAGMAAVGALGSAEAAQGGDPPREGGGPPAPKAVPDGPGGARRYAMAVPAIWVFAGSNGERAHGRQVGEVSSESRPDFNHHVRKRGEDPALCVPHEPVDVAV